MSMMSISGLASGLDSATIIDQLMQLEAMSQERLEAKVTAQNSVITALRQVNTRSSTLGSAAETLAKPETWQALKATSSNPLITVSTTAAAAPASLSLTVVNTAVAHRVGYSPAVSKTTDVVASADNSLALSINGGSPTTIPTDGTLEDVVEQINAKKLGVTAAMVRTGDGVYQLQVTSDSTGKASRFELTGLDTTVLTGASTVTGDDAEVDLGTGIVATSSTNTFTNLLDGVTVTLAPGAVGGTEPTTATLTVARDTASVASSVKGLVDKVNDLLTHLDGATNAGATGTRGALAGDSATRALRGALVGTVFGSDNTSLADVGIQTDRYGKLVFDEAKFKDAYAADPAGVTARFTSSAVSGAEGGWAARVAAATKAAYGPEGTVTTAITGREKSVERLKDSIADWDVRLELRRKTLTRTFTALEVALSNMNGQSSWLAGQIASLPKNSA